MKQIAIVRTPLRISFVGGGSDLPPGPGRTISTTINKHVYCIAKRRRDGKVYLSWRHREIVDDASDLKHEIVREALKMRGWYNGIEIHFVADIPGVGSGLGSSAATAVSVLHALLALQGYTDIDPMHLASIASELQIERLGKSQGRQDEYACALGGMNDIEYDEYGARVHNIDRITPDPFLLKRFEEHFMLFQPGECNGRYAEDILKSFTESKEWRYKCMQLCREFRSALDNSEFGNLPDIVYKHHMLKSSGFSKYDPEMERPDDELRFKLCGAGGTGHLLVGTIPEQRQQIKEHVEKIWGPELPFRTVSYGSRLVYSEDVNGGEGNQV